MFSKEKKNHILCFYYNLFVILVDFFKVYKYQLVLPSEVAQQLMKKAYAFCPNQNLIFITFVPSLNMPVL